LHYTFEKFSRFYPEILRLAEQPEFSTFFSQREIKGEKLKNSLLCQVLKVELNSLLSGKIRTDSSLRCQ